MYFCYELSDFSKLNLIAWSMLHILKPSKNKYHQPFINLFECLCFKIIENSKINQFYNYYLFNQRSDCKIKIITIPFNKNVNIFKNKAKINLFKRKKQFKK